MDGTNKDSKVEPGSVIAAILDFSPLSGPAGWNFKLFSEGLILSLISVFLIRAIGATEAGLMAIALASAAMTPRLNQVLEINRERIWSEEGSGLSANRTSLFSGLSIFLGMFVAFLVVGIVSNETQLHKDFSFILQHTRVDTDAILSPARFSQGMSIFGHNILVLVSFGVLGFVFRSLGTMIALGWNAGVWGITIVLFIGGGAESQLTPVLYAIVILVAIMPHLLTEAGAYVVGALSSVFLSRGVILYGIGDPRLNRVMVAVLLLALLSVALLAAGALLEHYVPALVLKAL
jgi:hypothetical protein